MVTTDTVGVNGVLVDDRTAVTGELEWTERDGCDSVYKIPPTMLYSFFWGGSPASEFYVRPFRNTPNVPPQ